MVNEVGSSIQAIIILLVGVGIATLVMIFVSVLGGQTYAQTISNLNTLGGTVADEAMGTANATGYLEASFAQTYARSETITCNDTATTNYTISSNTLIIDGADCQAATVVASYAYGEIDSYNNITAAVRSGFTAINTTGGYLPIIVLSVIIFIVLSLVTNLGGPAAVGRYNVL